MEHEEHDEDDDDEAPDNAFRQMTLLTEEQKHEFVRLLEDGLDLKETERGFTWNCSHDYQFAHARRALDQLGITVELAEQVLKFCQEHGGGCDCEIMLNVVCGE